MQQRGAGPRPQKHWSLQPPPQPVQRAQGRSHSPIPQAAECILRIVEKANAPVSVTYLSTDAAESETNLLQSLVIFNDRQVPLVKSPVLVDLHQ